MPGVRLHHPSLVSCTLVIETEVRYPVAYDCPACGKTHDRKAIHLRLDAEGDVIVAPAVLAALRRLPAMPLEVTNEVAKPPPLLVGAVAAPQTEIVEQPLGGNGQRFYVPGHDKYEAERRMGRLLEED